MKSLGQKLDFIADDRKDDFIRSVDPLSGSGVSAFFAAKGQAAKCYGRHPGLLRSLLRNFQRNLPIIMGQSF